MHITTRGFSHLLNEKQTLKKQGIKELHIFYELRRLLNCSAIKRQTTNKANTQSLAELNWCILIEKVSGSIKWCM